ncbi:CDP-alcohol phosphatidyltransferase family protein [Candidatus Poribacteria bacterium]|nr:CDP-alcohol phosphatidyltransferase family protein [Candidatus Poribacteria bacterium]MDE0689801.1 CDP-alcohol phosphatidyltransferase family protein [Candidatus Poribacteria bacterium]MXV82045.1 CDP-alcohol phosphatidyltransferase family protein [Candidatus Poribacteria bacterium]MYA58485.1 CDP-alcohol phosphatidyltransferase family protein [Candidatus Poribacteria bacterium]
MFEAKLKPRLEIILSLVANKMVAIGITANMVTLCGFVVNLIAAFYFATGRLVTGGILILFGGSFDMIDGAVARAQRNSRASGALLDSVIDRYSEGFLLLGALIYFYSLESLLGIVLAFSAWFGSILVSYVRARAEGLQVTCKVGLMQRPERIILLGAGTVLQGALLHKLPYLQSTGMILLCTLGILTLTSHITAIHRLIFSYQELSR